ncbi:unnamed protein product [Orchesella dallaii]|uniref:OTU domain-containing protein n=1 Tax=Orchesella dallaii TaxID=48710 RepID=A0ABP1PUK2_9HEXA
MTEQRSTGLLINQTGDTNHIVKDSLEEALENPNCRSKQQKNIPSQVPVNLSGTQSGLGEVIFDKIRTLKRGQTVRTEAILAKHFSFYINGTIKTHLDNIISLKEDIGEFRGHELFKETLQNLDEKSFNFNFYDTENAGTYNSAIENYTKVHGENEVPDFLEAVSILLVGDGSVATALRLLVFLETEKQSAPFEEYCNEARFPAIETKLRLLDPVAYATPPIIEATSQFLKRNLILYFGSYAVSDDAVFFGKFSTKQCIRVLALNGKFYPLFDKSNKRSVGQHLNFIDRPKLSYTTPAEDACFELKCALQKLTKPCQFCLDYRTNCTHITKGQVLGLQEFRNLLLDPRYGQFIANDFDQRIWKSNGTLIEGLNGKVLQIIASGDNHCFFNSISLCLVKTEDLAFALRKAVAIDFHKNELHYFKLLEKMGYKDNEMKCVRKKVFQLSSWAEDEVILLMSKIISRKIIVYSPMGPSTYDLNSSQSNVYPPLILHCTGVHFSPLIPHSTVQLELPLSRSVNRNQFVIFDRFSVTDLLTKSVSAGNNTDPPPVAASVSNSEKKQQHSYVRPVHIKESDFNDCMSIVAEEIKLMISRGSKKNIIRFTNNITIFKLGFWKPRLQKIFLKRKKGFIEDKARKFGRLCQSEYARHQISKKLLIMGASFEVANLYQYHAAELVAGSNKVRLDQRGHSKREQAHLGLMTQSYKAREAYMDYEIDEGNTEENVPCSVVN